MIHPASMTLITILSFPYMFPNQTTGNGPKAVTSLEETSSEGMSLTIKVEDSLRQGHRTDDFPASMLESCEFPPPPTDLGVFTESITKTTFTETTTTRVTDNKLLTSASSLNNIIP